MPLDLIEAAVLFEELEAAEREDAAAQAAAAEHLHSLNTLKGQVKAQEEAWERAQQLAKLKREAVKAAAQQFATAAGGGQTIENVVFWKAGRPYAIRYRDSRWAITPVTVAPLDSSFTPGDPPG